MISNIKKENQWGAIDLCCGMGGLSYAAFIEGVSPLIGIDNSKPAVDTFKQNFSSSIAICENVSNPNVIERCRTEVNKQRKANRNTLILSGPPCQGFSVAGRRDPSDPRNKVLVDVAEIIADLQPNAAIIENVPALLKKEYDPITRQFEKILRKANYFVYNLTLNALDFGTPQRRARVIFIITKSKIPKKLLKSYLEKQYRKPKKIKDVIGDLPTPKVRLQNYDPRQDNGSIPNHYAMAHSGRVKKKIAAIPIGRGPLSYRKLDPEGHSITLISGHRAPPVHYSEPRSITTREALRLQGFPDTFRIMGSFGKQMEQVTNAVPLHLGRTIIRTLVEILESTNHG